MSINRDSWKYDPDPECSCDDGVVTGKLSSGRVVEVACMCVLVRKSLRAPLKKAIKEVTGGGHHGE